MEPNSVAIQHPEGELACFLNWIAALYCY